MKRQLLIAQLAMLLEKRAAQDRLGRQPLSPGLVSAVSAQILGRELIPPLEGVHADARAPRSDTKAKLLAGIAKARAWVDELIAGRILDIADLAQREKRSVRSTTMLLSLAFLAPGLVQAIAENRLPRGIGLTRLADLPSEWSEQFMKLGLQAPR